MAELPELTILQRQMHEALAGRTIDLVEVRQEKCLNELGVLHVGGLQSGETMPRMRDADRIDQDRPDEDVHLSPVLLR